MQAPFSLLANTLEQIRESLSPARFGRYLHEAGGDPQLAIQLYQWNAEIGQALFWPLQTLEVVYRNGVCRALADKFGARWHRSPAFRRVLDPVSGTALDDAL